MPAPVFAEVKSTGTTCPSFIARTNVERRVSAVSFSPERYFSSSASSTSTTASTSARCASFTEPNATAPVSCSKQSTTSSRPAVGRLMGNSREPSAALSSANRLGSRGGARSSLFTTTMRASPASPAA